MFFNRSILAAVAFSAISYANASTSLAAYEDVLGERFVSDLDRLMAQTDSAPEFIARLEAYGDSLAVYKLPEETMRTLENIYYSNTPGAYSMDELMVEFEEVLHASVEPQNHRAAVLEIVNRLKTELELRRGVYTRITEVALELDITGNQS